MSIKQDQRAEKSSKTTNIIVFQRGNSGVEKIKGIKEFGNNIRITDIITVDAALPDFIDNPEDFITAEFNADLALSFLKHPDLNDYLAELCLSKKIPLIASGTKTEFAITPFTCCGLGHHKNLGEYGIRFGFPEFKARLDKNDRITDIVVKRGASCGATWYAASKIIGLTLQEALPTLAREVQYLCSADPSAFDPLSGKSALHYAGEVHKTALLKALKKTRAEVVSVHKFKI